MMARFCGYLDKVFQFRSLMGRLTDSRPEPEKLWTSPTTVQHLAVV